MAGRSVTSMRTASAASTTRLRSNDMWADTGVISRARTFGDTSGPPAENA